jgi:hypothetical protein
VLELERLIPRSARKTNQVYVASEAEVLPLAQIDDDAANKVVFINDDRQLEHFVSECKTKDKVGRHTGARRILENVLNSSSFSIPFYKLDLAKWSLENKITPTGLQDFEFVLIREDELSDINIGEFLQFFSATPPLRQPRVLFMRRDENSRLDERLCYVNPNVTASQISGMRFRPLDILRAEPRTLADFASLYETRCFEIAANVRETRIGEWLNGEHELSQLIMLVTRTRARLLTSERHDVEPEVDKILRRINGSLDSSGPSDLEPYLYLRTTALLQKLYCSEDARYLNEAMGLSSALGDEFGLAACMRFAEFLDVHPALSAHMYRRAERIFRVHESFDLAIYSKNNRLVSQFRQQLEENEFPDILGEIRSTTPSLYRRHDIQYNAGVHELLAGHIDRAHEIFCDPAFEDGRPLIVASARLGALTCDRAIGNPLDSDAILRFADYVLTDVPGSNRWHIRNIFLNLLVLVRDDPTLARDILELVRPHTTSYGKTDVRDRFRENERLESVLGLRPDTSTIKIPGPFGVFQDAYGVALPYYFIWS